MNYLKSIVSMVPNKKFDKNFFSSGVYRNYKKVLSEWVKPVAKKIYKRLKDKPSPKILDAGCGFGNLLAEFQNKYHFQVQGLEHSYYARLKADSSVRKKIQKGSILTPPFERNSFDAVICFDVVLYFTLEETKKVIQNLVDISNRYIFFTSIYRHSRDASQKNNPDPLRKVVLPKKEYIDIFSQSGAKFIENFYGENGGDILVFKKI